MAKSKSEKKNDNFPDNPYLIGYRAPKGKVYGVYSHLGGFFISEKTINAYYDPYGVIGAYKRVVESSKGRYIVDKLNISMPPQFRGGRVFITRAKSAKCEFGFAEKFKPIGFGGVSLRNNFTLK
jgi:hypothetical protein